MGGWVTSDRSERELLEGGTQTGSPGIATSSAQLKQTEEANRTTSHYLATKHRRDRPIASPRIAKLQDLALESID